jgi:type I restriction enzyme R subunit
VAFELAFFRHAPHARRRRCTTTRQRLTVARQLHYSVRGAKKSVDLSAVLNGLPVATVELKNPNTGQDVDHAIAQYRQRDPTSCCSPSAPSSTSPSTGRGFGRHPPARQ